MNITKNNYLNNTFMLVISFALACGIAFMIPGGKDFELYDSVIRIHVVANSDSDTDQSLKLKVRDEIIAVTNMLLQDCTDIRHARQIIGDNLPLLEKTARNVQKDWGLDYGVNASFKEEYYPTRNYSRFRLPAGKYTSLKLTLGDGMGKNWWCVIYPAFCLDAASAPLQKITVMDTDAPMTYQIKFKVLEWMGTLIQKIDMNTI